MTVRRRPRAIRSRHVSGCADGAEHTAPVGRYGAGPSGVADIAGNVAEWVDVCAKPGREGGGCPVHRFRGLSWLDDDGDEAKVTGNLTLNGVSKPVTLDVDFHGAGTNPYNKKATIGFEAEGKIRRSDFGIAYGIPAVSDEVELEIHAAFEKQ